MLNAADVNISTGSVKRCHVFCYAGSGSGQSGSGQIQNIESLKRLYSVCWGGNKWTRRSLGGELQCGGLRPLCESFLGGSSVEEGLRQPDRVP